jgi:hypothetical protein
MKKEMNLEELYKTNNYFKGYVERFANHYGLTTEEALSHAMVRSYAGYLMERK